MGIIDPAGDVDRRAAGRDEVRRMRELAAELTADQRLVLACQVALGMGCGEFCERFGWSHAKFRKVAMRARARLRVGVGALLPVPPTVDPEVAHRFGILGRGLGRLLPFWDTGESAAAVKAGAAGAAAAGGTGAAAAGGGSLLGLGAAKVGIVALCAAGAASSYVVCDQIGLFAGRCHASAITARQQRPRLTSTPRNASRRRR